MANQEDGGNAVFFSSNKYQLDQTNVTLLTSEPQPPTRQHHSRLRQMRSRLSWHGNFFTPAVTLPLPPLPDDRQYPAQDARPGVSSGGKLQQENQATTRLDGSYSSPSVTSKPKLRIDTNFSAKQSQRPQSKTVTGHQAEVADTQPSISAKPGIFGLRRLLRRSRQAPMPRFPTTSTAGEEYIVLDDCVQEETEITQVSQPGPVHRLGTMQHHQPLVGNWDTSTSMHPPNPPPPLRKKSSMIDRLRVLRPRPSSQALDSQSIEHSTVNVAPYVPKHAASDFSRIRVNPRSRESTTLGGSLSSRSAREADGRQALLADGPAQLWSIADQTIEDEPAKVFPRRNTVYPRDQPDKNTPCPSEQQQTRPCTPDLQIRSGDSPSPASTEYSLCRYDSGIVSPLSAASPEDSQRYTTIDDAVLSSPLSPGPKRTPADETKASKTQPTTLMETPSKQSRAIISTPTTSPDEKVSSDYRIFLEHAAQKHRRQHEQMWHKLATPDGQVVYTTNTALNEDEPRWKRSAAAQPTTQVEQPQRYSGGGSSNNVFGQKDKALENRRGGRGLGRRISQYLRPTRESNVWDEKVLRLSSRDV